MTTSPLATTARLRAWPRPVSSDRVRSGAAPRAVEARQDADAGAAAASHAAGDGLHDARHAAVDHHAAALGEQLSELLAERGDRGAAGAAADHADVGRAASVVAAHGRLGGLDARPGTRRPARLPAAALRPSAPLPARAAGRCAAQPPPIQPCIR